MLAISTIAQTIQLSVAPVFLLAGIGAILNMLAGRLARVVDRSRAIERLHPESTGAEHVRHVGELRVLDRRIRLISGALTLCVSSAILVCVVVAMLFVAALADLHMGNVVAVSFVLSMLLLTIGLVAFLIETRVSTRSVRVRAELLERGR